MRRILTLVIALAVCAPLSACGSSSSPSTTSPSTSASTTSATTTSLSMTASPRVALAAMRNAARSQHSVHYVSVSSAPGHTIRIVADVGATEGISRTTVRDHSQTGKGTTIVSGGNAFLRGDAFWMRVFFGFTKQQATKYAGQWISVASSHPAYPSVSDDLTFPSFFSHLFAPQRKLSLVIAQRLIGVHGTVSGKSDATATTTIFAPAQGEPLPVKQTANSSGDLGAGVVTMSKWGEPVHVPTPRGAVPIKTVFGG